MAKLTLKMNETDREPIRRLDRPPLGAAEAASTPVDGALADAVFVKAALEGRS